MKKKTLTEKRASMTLKWMPKQNATPIGQKRSKDRPLKIKRPAIQERYLNYFIPTPSPLWRSDDDNFSLEQPSPYKWVPSETTYGIDVTLCPTPNA